MQAARPRSARRRPRRGSVERPIDTRLLRGLWLVIALPLLLLLVTVSRTGPYPAPTLPPSFDRANAVALTRDLALEHAERVPGSPGAEGAAQWFADNIAEFGLAVGVDAWSENVPALGRTVELRNLSVVIEGTQRDAILIVAHRDNTPGTAGANDDASGTAALVELARGFATVGTGGAEPRRPLHTVILLSTDAGAYGSLGALRFVEHSPLADRVGAAVVLDGLAGANRPRLEIAGLERTSPTQALVRTLAARIGDTGSPSVERPTIVRQLVSLALPFGYGEQAPLLRDGIPAVRLTTTSDAREQPGTDEVEDINATRLGQLGTAVDETLTSLDAAVELPRTTSSQIFVGRRAIKGWALELLLIAATVPFAVAALDLAGRCRRRRISLLPAWRALRRRLLWWLTATGILFAATLIGIFPDKGATPPTPYDPPGEDWVAVSAIGCLVVVAITWLSGRRSRGRSPSDDDRLAGWAAALLALGFVGVVAIIVSPYLLVFLLPSLYAWLLVPHVPARQGWLPDLLFGLGFIGPVAALVTLAVQFDLGLAVPTYALQLITSGTIPAGATLALLGWAAVAVHVGSLVAGSYAPVGAPSSRR